MFGIDHMRGRDLDGIVSENKDCKENRMVAPLELRYKELRKG